MYFPLELAAMQLKFGAICMLSNAQSGFSECTRVLGVEGDQRVQTDVTLLSRIQSLEYKSVQSRDKPPSPNTWIQPRSLRKSSKNVNLTVRLTAQTLWFMGVRMSP